LIDVITLTDVAKKYDPKTTVWAVKDINLSVTEGEFLCIVGPSGCGKSTVLKMIAGLEELSSGQLNRVGKISMVFQSGALFPWLNVYENIKFGLQMQGISDQKAKPVVEQFLEIVGLEHFGKKYPRELSGGQKQRVGIARALAVDPQVLLLDEPFSALDTLTTESLHKDLLKIWHQTKLTIIMVSHLLEEAVLLSDRVAVMKEGKLKEVITIQMQRPRSNVEPEFLRDLKELKKVLHS
jgi:ABC-type nitrate/sulfonate/bicarbonate transport system ATPase subunit